MPDPKQQLATPVSTEDLNPVSISQGTQQGARWLAQRHPLRSTIESLLLRFCAEV